MPPFENSPAVKRSLRTILIADIKSRSRELRCKAFRSLGADVQSAEDGDSAMAQYRDGSFDLVLIDLGGDIKGAESLASAMRAINPYQKISFFVSGPELVSAFPVPKRTTRHSVPTATGDISVPTATRDIEESRPTAQSDFGRRITEAAKLQ